MTENLPFLVLRNSRAKGSFLILSVLLLTLVAALTLAGVAMSTGQEIYSRFAGNHLNAQLASTSAVQRQVAEIAGARDMSTSGDPWAVISALDKNSASGEGGFTQTVSGEVLFNLDGDSFAEIDTFVDVNAVSSSKREVTVTSYAYVPSKAAYQASVTDAVRADATTVLEVEYDSSRVFDYSYFINHWGWFFGHGIVSNGNVRANGNFDFGGYKSTINGSPRYDSSDGPQLIGYLDDNGDGITDGSDGGVYAGMDVVNSQNVRGMGGEEENQHYPSPKITMPNLSDLSLYEKKAAEFGSTLTVGKDKYITDGVLGDDTKEKENLYLVGTKDDPIELNGPVVVRGHVVLSGYVTGQGTIYAGGNVYVPNDLVYLNPPSTTFPDATDQASVEQWRKDATTKDYLGLFAREHIIVGDFTHSWWQSNVSHWLNDKNNRSEEDAGADGIHNTRAGADGVMGTADDDVMEGDGTWTVSHYTQDDADRGMVPPGKSVGDVIPGSGEDIDGDGVYDGRTSIAEFEFDQSIENGLWEGPIKKAIPRKDYNEISTIYVKQIDAILYTNHTLGALMINWGGDVSINGAVVSRNEAIIYGADRLVINHDERLTGGGMEVMSQETPITWNPLKLLRWDYERDLPATVLGSPDSIASHLTGN